MSSKSKSEPHPQLPAHLSIQFRTFTNPQPGPPSHYCLPPLLRSSSTPRTPLLPFHRRAPPPSPFCIGRQGHLESDGYLHLCSARCPGILRELAWMRP